MGDIPAWTAGDGFGILGALTFPFIAAPFLHLVPVVPIVGEAPDLLLSSFETTDLCSTSGPISTEGTVFALGAVAPAISISITASILIACVMTAFVFCRRFRRRVKS